MKALPLSLLPLLLLLASCTIRPKPSPPKDTAKPPAIDSIALDSIARDSAGWITIRDTVFADSALPDDSTQRAWGDTLLEIPPLPDFRNPAAQTRNQWGLEVRALPSDLRHVVRVGIEVGVHQVKFFSLGRVDLLEIQGRDVSRLMRYRGTFYIQRQGNIFEVLDENFSRLAVARGDLQLRSVNPYNLLEVQGISYRGNMELYPYAPEKLVVANVLDMEDYLRGVVPVEMGNVDRNFLEALKVQAVAARTYALKRLLNPAHARFDLFRDVMDQVYGGRSVENVLSDRAVRETRGIVVLHADTLAHCYYHSTCGGHTAEKGAVWTGTGSPPYLLGVKDEDGSGKSPSFCRSSRYYTWRESWSRAQLTEIVRQNLASANVPEPAPFTRIEKLEVTSRTPSGRVAALTISTDRGAYVVRGDRVRWALRRKTADRPILPSSWFSIARQDGTILLEGRGLGHGIGMCQMGARGRAQAGQSFLQILSAYYPGTLLVEYR